MVTRARIVTLALGCAVLAGLGYAGAGAQRALRGLDEPKSASHERSMRGPRTLGPFVLGSTRSAGLRVKIAVAPKQQKSPEAMELRGELRQTPTDIEGATVLVRTELRNAAVTIASPGRDSVASGADDAARRMATAFSRPFFVRYAENGRLLEVHFEKDCPRAISDTLGALMAKTQFVRQAGPETWVQREADEGGTYLAAYTRLSEREYTKKKLSYLEGAGTSPLDVPAKVESFEARVELDGSGWTRRWSLEEALELPIAPAHGLALASRLSLGLESGLVAVEPGLIGGFTRERSRFEQRLLGQRGQGDEAVAVDSARRRLAGQTFSSLSAKLPRIAPRGERSPDDGRSDLVTAFRDLYLSDPSTLDQALGALGSLPVEQASVLVNAMGMLDSQTGSAALTRVIQDSSLGDEKRGLAVRMIGFTRHVPPNVEGALLELARGPTDRLGRQARLASGAVASQLRALDAERSLRLTKELVARFEAASDARLREDWLMALGNAGHPVTLPTLLRVARGNDVLASRAIDALRRIDGAEVDQVLNEFLLSTEDRKRSAAIDAAGQREIGPFIERLVAIVERDKNEQLRSTAAQVLGRSLRRHPQLEGVLSRVAAEDASESVRRHAGRFLARTSPKPAGSGMSASNNESG